MKNEFFSEKRFEKFLKKILRLKSLKSYEIFNALALNFLARRSCVSEDLKFRIHILLKYKNIFIRIFEIFLSSSSICNSFVHSFVTLL